MLGFVEIHLKAGNDGNDLMLVNPNCRIIETLANRAAIQSTSDPEDYIETARVLVKDEMVIVIALWLMICILLLILSLKVLETKTLHVQK